MVIVTDDAPERPERVLPATEADAALPADDRFAAELRGFGPVGIVAMLLILFGGNARVGSVMVPVGALLVLLWARSSNTAWREIGYVRPRSWLGALVVGLAFGIAFKLAMKAVVMPLLGAPPVNATYHYLARNRAALPAAAWAMINAGFAEETVFRGYLFERLGKLLGSGVRARILIVLVTTALFGLAHYPDQGLPGVEQALFTGLAFGTIFALTGRIFLLMCAHAGFDLTALAIIYRDAETAVAHLIFR